MKCSRRVLCVLCSLMLVALLCSGCEKKNSYEPGIYASETYLNKSAGFGIHNPEGFAVLNDEADPDNPSGAYTLKSSNKAYTCEYGVTMGLVQAGVFVTDKAEGSTIDSFAQSVSDNLGTTMGMTTGTNEDVDLGGKTFRYVSTSTTMVYSDYYITETEDKFIASMYFMVALPNRMQINSWMAFLCANRMPQVEKVS